LLAPVESYRAKVSALWAVVLVSHYSVRMGVHVCVHVQYFVTVSNSDLNRG